MFHTKILQFLAPKVKEIYLTIFFTSNFTMDNINELPESNSFVDPNLTVPEFSIIAKVRLLLSTIDQHYAAGPDSLPGTVLKVRC